MMWCKSFAVLAAIGISAVCVAQAKDAGSTSTQRVEQGGAVQTSPLKAPPTAIKPPANKTLSGGSAPQSNLPKPTVPQQATPPPKVQQIPASSGAGKSSVPAWNDVRPRITSVRLVRTSAEGPVAGTFFANGDLVEVGGENFGSETPRAGFQYGGRVASLIVSGGRRPSDTSFAVFMPSREILTRAGISVPDNRAVNGNLVLLAHNGQVLASYPIRYGLRSPNSDHDGDGVTVAQGDCNDFDPSIYAGNVELSDINGKDEDCNPTTYGAVDRDGDGFPDAANYNVDKATRRIYRGTDCNDTDPTANPIRPENCPAGTRPAERDAALMRTMR